MSVLGLAYLPAFELQRAELLTIAMVAVWVHAATSFVLGKAAQFPSLVPPNMKERGAAARRPCAGRLGHPAPPRPHQLRHPPEPPSRLLWRAHPERSPLARFQLGEHEGRRVPPLRLGVRGPGRRWHGQRGHRRQRPRVSERGQICLNKRTKNAASSCDEHHHLLT